MIPYRMNPLGSGWPKEGSYGVFLTSSGTAVSSAIVTSGAIVSGTDYEQAVYSHGTARETVVSSGGIQIVSSGGVTTSSILDGGRQIVSSGASASYTVINNGGLMLVSSGGISISAAVSSGGTATVYSGAADSQTTIWGTMYVGGTANSNIAGSGGHLLTRTHTNTGT